MSDITITTSAVPESGSSAPASPAPAPAVSPPSDTGTAAPAGSPAADTARPRTFADALARRAQADTALPAPTDPTAAAAPSGEDPTVPPDSLEDASADPNAPPAQQTSGPIPFARHKAALDNARTKTREEVIGQVQQEYGDHIRLGEAFRSNPVEAAIQVLSELQGNPAFAPQLKSMAARMLANRAPAAAEAAAPEPDLTGVDGNGQQVRFYSAEGQAKRDAWLARRLLSQIKQEIAPLQTAHRQTEADRAEQARVAEVTASVSSRLQAWRQQPGFAEHEAALRPVQADLVAKGMDPWNAIGLAYAQVVVPKLRATHQTQMVAEAARKAAGTTDNPSTVTPTPPTRPKTFAEALERRLGR